MKFFGCVVLFGLGDFGVPAYAGIGLIWHFVWVLQRIVEEWTLSSDRIPDCQCQKNRQLRVPINPNWRCKLGFADLNQIWREMKFFMLKINQLKASNSRGWKKFKVYLSNNRDKWVRKEYFCYLYVSEAA